MKEFSKEHSFMAKGIAIVLLLLYHLFHEEHVLVQMNVNYAPFSENGILMVSGFGNICVAIFVMITAYGITKSVLSKENIMLREIGTASVKRFGKLMLNFFWVYVTVNIVCFSYFDHTKLYGEGKQGVLFAICDALGLSQIFGTPMLNETWWYMKLAYILIFFVPLIALLIRKMGTSLLLLAFFAPMVVNFDKDVERYLFVAIFGVCAAYGNWIEKVMNLRLHWILKWLIGIVGSVLCVLVRQNAAMKDYFWNIIDAPIAFFLICVTVMTLGSVPVLNKVLAFVGKHSMNIFLMHTFLYLIVFRKYIYYFEYAIITFLILLMVSLAYSVVLELFKKYVGIFLKNLRKKTK